MGGICPVSQSAGVFGGSTLGKGRYETLSERCLRAFTHPASNGDQDPFTVNSPPLERGGICLNTEPRGSDCKCSDVPKGGWNLNWAMKHWDR